MRSIRRVTLRVAPALASVASVFLFATCDFDKISGTPTKLSQEDINRLFSITPSDTAIILGSNQQFTVSAGQGVSLDGTTTRWSSSSPSVLEVDSTGFANALTIGTSTITARLLAPELDTGYVKTHELRVRFKGIDACTNPPTRCSPFALDSIPGLNLSRPFSFFGTNASDVRQLPALTGVTITTRDSGATTNTVASFTGNAVFARKNGVAYVIGVFEDMRDSIKVKVRQVAKSLVFPTTDYVANALNADRQVPIVMTDVNDSVMTESPTLRWRSSDPAVVEIDSITGIFRVKERSSALVYVSVDTIPEMSQLVRLEQVVTELQRASEDPRQDIVAMNTAIAPAVRALDAGGEPVPGDTITFRVGDGLSTITDSVQITDANGLATLGSWKIGDQVGTYTVVAQSRTTSATFTTTAVPQRPFALQFQQNPGNAGVDQSLSTVTVSVVDSLGNAITDATNDITIALANNPSAATLNGTTTVSAVNGVATFTALSVNAIGTGYTLSASSAGLSNAISNAFSVFGGATQVAFIQQPSDVTEGVPFSPAIQVAILDANGTVVTNETSGVTLALASNPGGTIIVGNTTVAAVNGIATFPDLHVDIPTNGYTMQATSGALTPATSNSFNVRPIGSPAKLAFLNGPASSTVAGEQMADITVEVQDADGARVTTSSAFVNLGIQTNPGNAVLLSTGDLGKVAVNGVVTFSGVSIAKAGSGYVLTATSSGLAQANSAPLDIVPGSVANMGFVTQPTHTTVGATISPPPQVALTDAHGNVVTGSGAFTISLSINSGTLNGTTSAQTVNGIATFNDLTVPTTGGSRRLEATVTDGPGAFPSDVVSDLFSVVSETGASRLRWFTSPASTTAGNSLSNVQVEVINAQGNRVTTAQPFIQISVATGPGSISQFSTTGTTAFSGIAFFNNVQLEKAGNYTLKAQGSGFGPVESNPFEITFGSINKIGFLVAPSGEYSSGAALSPAIEVAVMDQFDNVVTNASNSVTISFSNAPFGASLSGTTTRSAVNGVATFDDLSSVTAGSYRFVAEAPSCCSPVLSPFFSVVPGTAVGLGFQTQPFNVIANATMPSVQVKLQDASGNVVTSATNPITLALTGGDATAVLGGTTTRTPTNGVATFDDLSIDKIASGYKLNASASGFSTVSSNTFSATAGPADHLTWIVQPTNATGGQKFNVQVAVSDAHGNILTGDNRQISLSIAGATGTPGAFLSGDDLAVQAVNGVATFSNVSVDKVGTGYQLSASTFALPAALSDPFDIAIGPASKLTFTVQPSAVTATQAISPSVEVSVTDAGGNVIPGAAHPITISKTSNTGHFQGVLSGTLQKNAVDGTAVFDDLSIDRSASCYRLTVTTPDLAGAESDCFNVNTGSASKLVVNSQPGTVTSNQTFTVSVSITDAGGNNVQLIQQVNAGIASGPPGANLSGTLSAPTNSNGDISFSDLKLDKAGTYQLTFTSGGLTAATTTDITVIAGEATQIVWGQQPVNTFLNAPLGAGGPQPTLIFQDDAGNTTSESLFPNNFNEVRIFINSGPSLTFQDGQGFVSATAANGVVTIPESVKLPLVGNYELRVEENNPFRNPTNPPNSVSFSVSEFDVPAKLSWNNQPDDGGYSVRLLSSGGLTPNVFIQDQWDNLITNASDNITVAIGTDPSGSATLGGTLTVAAAGGGSGFADLRLDRTGSGFTLVASSGGLEPAISNQFSITTPGNVTAPGFFLNDMVRVGDRIYFTHNSALQWVSIYGGDVTTVTASSDPKQIATDGTHVYWMERNSNSGDAVVKKLELPGGTITTLTTGQSGVTESSAFSTDGTNVYFITRSTATDNYHIQSVSVNASNAPPTDLFPSGQNSVDPQFVVSGGLIYYYDPGTGEIVRMTTAGAIEATVVTVVSDVKHLAMSGTRLVYVEVDGTIKSVFDANTVSNATPNTHDSVSGTLYDFSVDGGYLYVRHSDMLTRFRLSDMDRTNMPGTGTAQLYYHSTLFDDEPTPSLYFLDSSGRITKHQK